MDAYRGLEQKGPTYLIKQDKLANGHNLMLRTLFIMQLALRAPATMISQMTLRDPTQHFVYVEERESRETQEMSLIPTPSSDEF